MAPFGAVKKVLSVVAPGVKMRRLSLGRMGWTARSSKRSYYHNVVSGETVSERPHHVMGHYSEEHDATYYIGRDGLPTWEAPEASSWEAHHSEEHDRPFFHNSKTGQTVWEAPADTNVAWQQWFHEVEEL